MGMIAIAGFAVIALLVFQHGKGSTQRYERVRARRNERSTHGQTDVPDDRC